MKGPHLVAALLLLALPPQPARSSVIAAELAFEGARAAAPAVVPSSTFPFNFGNQPLGTISTVTFSFCFKQPASPPASCDASGTVGLQQQLAPPFYLAGTFREDVATGLKTQVSLPVNLAAGQRLVLYNQWVSSQLGSADGSLVLQATPTGGVGDSLTLVLAGSGVTPGTCTPSPETLCLNNDRFKVQAHFLTSTAQSGLASGVKLTGDTGYLYFFDPLNLDVVIRVLDACSLNSRYWVFAAGLTNIRTVISVTDTERAGVKTYINPQGSPFQPVLDTSAFATCP